MAKKHFDEYFNKVAKDYHDLLCELQDMEQEFNEKIIPPETYEQMKRIIEPIKRNYQTLNYVSYLLNMPNRKKKRCIYANQHKKQLTDSLNDEAILSENRGSLQELENIFNS